ncbi:MYG1 family protein [Capillimicrobium parvum]|uniref:Metal-dependent hydrolase n=1 Tax=Capillimicrobium parvum TaxID=2884022 RepID=A0A9E7C166_9ACTN|nr:MYG1 family protein [Capillimicrobium parvum]UGS36118.1 hypothetical protein DSM104329_02518 [Capillimicrobium parvum]
MRVATHPGGFHADDVFAIAALGLAAGPLEIARKRDEAPGLRQRGESASDHHRTRS